MLTQLHSRGSKRKHTAAKMGWVEGLHGVQGCWALLPERRWGQSRAASIGCQHEGQLGLPMPTGDLLKTKGPTFQPDPKTRGQQGVTSGPMPNTHPGLPLLTNRHPGLPPWLCFSRGVCSPGPEACWGTETREPN